MDDHKTKMILPDQDKLHHNGSLVAYPNNATSISDDGGREPHTDSDTEIYNELDQKNLLLQKTDDSGSELSNGTVSENLRFIPEFTESREKLWQIALQVFFPYIIAGYGMVAAGSVLEIVQDWAVFKNVSEVIILVPPLLGLKGNLEMTLASRLSTQANLGHMDTASEQWLMIGGNLALVQVQAIVVGLLAALFSIVLGWVPLGKVNLLHGCMLCASSVITAALASFVLGSVMVGVIMLSRKFYINPDNVATPVAASLGDLTTISLLAIFSTLLYNTLENHLWISPVLLVILLLMIPLWWYFAHHNKYTCQTLYSGWTPVIGAMVISSVGGLVLDYTLSVDGVAAFQPVINGVGGNLVAVQASRLSTALHKVSIPGRLPRNVIKGCPNICTTFFGKDISSRTNLLLMLMVVPGQLIFLLTIYLMNETKNFKITPIFALIYFVAATLQVAILLYVANWLVHFLWKRGNDPDNFSIPYLTAMGDLLGTLLLAFAFLLYGLTQ